MNWRRPTWWFLHRGRGPLSREAGAALFQGLRIRLTLWYCVVLGAALVLFSVALYFSVQHFLLSPIEDAATASANSHVIQWFADRFDHGCNPSGPSGQSGPPSQGQSTFEMIACFDQNGSLLVQYGYTTSLSPAFLNNNLAQMALESGQASDIVDAGGSVGQIYRYAQVIPNPTGNGNLGVVVIGESIQAQETELSLLLTLLLAIGSVALLGAGLGGLFLANRALAPARLAWSNQQRFIADAAHELRTPLTLLRADAEVLLRGRARLDNRFSHQEHEVVSLAELAQEAVRRVQSFAEQRGITVQVENTNDPYVIGDPMLLEQAVLGLLDNAIKYNRQGGRISVRTAVQDGQALLEVRDTGIGIAAEHLPHLGERFYRVDKARSREAGGTGLGLSIARGIAVAHGGRLALASVPGQGTTVTLTLPLAHGDYLDNVPGSMSSLPEKLL